LKEKLETDRRSLSHGFWCASNLLLYVVITRRWLCFKSLPEYNLICCRVSGSTAAIVLPVGGQLYNVSQRECAILFFFSQNASGSQYNSW
jgi:hypothetical protein